MSFFITFEGGEGVGKSSVIREVENWLREKSNQVMVTREPGGTTIADDIRALLFHNSYEESFTKEAELCLMSAARSQHLKHKIEPALKNKTWVLCDRYADSSLVYQQELGGLDTGLCESVIRLTTQDREPDLTFLLDCDVKVSMARLLKRAASDGESNRYDKAEQEQHQNIRDAYLKLAHQNQDRIKVIDADRDVETICREVKDIIEERFS